jgi:hypothetical protein
LQPGLSSVPFGEQQVPHLTGAENRPSNRPLSPSLATQWAASAACVWEGPYGMYTGGTQVSVHHGMKRARRLMKTLESCINPRTSEKE